ncbi:YjaG family protein [Alkalimonas sp. MEB108]|uniref:YjaG family protein n=1 Tax=Alkalimonas cellulosilytica TaxID=3058395 RepID=A0ABU7J3T8_9GAMM|nr:YjaG family protein [Alkalimonas sp. MEB108]MEE2001146.1 YjaG family protein [Alkalimonas sp. MEB108]
MKATNFQRLRELGFYQQVAVAATLMERMLPNYQLFSEVMDYGDASVLRHTLDLIWEFLAVKKAKINFARLGDELAEITPEINHFDCFGVYPAVDTATALDALINGIEQRDAVELINVAKISQASVARLIEHESAELDITSEAELKQHVRKHPLMQYEMDCLAELIELVAEIPQFDWQQVKKLRLWVAEQGVSNLGMELTVEDGTDEQ